MRKIKAVLLQEQAERIMAKEAIREESNVQEEPPRPADYQQVPLDNNRIPPPQAPSAYHWQGAYEQENQRNAIKEQEFI